MAALNESGVKSLLEHLQGDFKAISGEAKKKLPAVKEVTRICLMTWQWPISMVVTFSASKCIGNRIENFRLTYKVDFVALVC